MTGFRFRTLATNLGLFIAAWAALTAIVVLCLTVAGTRWSLAVVAGVVGLAFFFDRFRAFMDRRAARRQARLARRRYHTVSNASGEVVAFFPRDRAA